jgi:hypothetical protein
MTTKELTFFNEIPMFASFPYLFEPRTTDIEGRPLGYDMFEVTGVINPQHPMWLKFETQVKALALRVLREKFGPKAEFGKGYRDPFTDGNTKDLDKYPNYKDRILFPMKSNNRAVDLVDIQGFKLTDKRSIYPGCIIVPSFGFYAYNNVSKGVSGALRCVMKIADSTPWVTIASAERDFKGFDASQYEEIDNSQMYAGSGMADV